jgi:transposase-like protein
MGAKGRPARAKAGVSPLRLGGRQAKARSPPAPAPTMAQARPRGRFTAACKSEAARRREESGRSLQQAADALGVYAHRRRGWCAEPRAPGSVEALARRKTEAAALARLRAMPITSKPCEG